MMQFIIDLIRIKLWLSAMIFMNLFDYIVENEYICIRINDIIMDGLILIILGIYIFSKMFGGGDKKKKRSKRKSTFWGDTSTYSDYDAWNRSHGSDNKLF